MVVSATDIPKIWVARDVASSGMYTIWVYNKPKMSKAGYYEADTTCHPLSILLISIHPVKFPWDALKLDRGDCIEVEMDVIAIDTTRKVVTE